MRDNKMVEVRRTYYLSHDFSASSFSPIFFQLLHLFMSPLEIFILCWDLHSISWWMFTNFLSRDYSGSNTYTWFWRGSSQFSHCRCLFFCDRFCYFPLFQFKHVMVDSRYMKFEHCFNLYCIFSYCIQIILDSPSTFFSSLSQVYLN